MASFLIEKNWFEQKNKNLKGKAHDLKNKMES
jgi:hypothetical protein